MLVSDFHALKRWLDRSLMATLTLGFKERKRRNIKRKKVERFIHKRCSGMKDLEMGKEIGSENDGPDLGVKVSRIRTL